MKKMYIACCGDSITYGLGATNTHKSYPSILQLLLGESFVVENYGKSGATVINDYEVVPDRYSPYLKSQEYVSAINSEPNIVVLMLGMNDGNPTHHFNMENGGIISSEYLQLYKNTLVNIVEKFEYLSTKPTIYLIETTAMKRKVCNEFSKKYVDDFTNNLLAIRKMQKHVAAEKNIVFVNTVSQMQDERYYVDGCHLSDDGYYKLANIIKKAIK